MFAHKDRSILFIPASFFKKTLKCDENHLGAEGSWLFWGLLVCRVV